MNSYENLLIRACKKRNVSHYVLRRIFSHRCGLDVGDVKDKVVTRLLIEIVQKYALADLNKLFLKYYELVSFNDTVFKLCPDEA